MIPGKRNRGEEDPQQHKHHRHSGEQAAAAKTAAKASTATKRSGKSRKCKLRGYQQSAVPEAPTYAAGDAGAPEPKRVRAPGLRLQDQPGKQQSRPEPAVQSESAKVHTGDDEAHTDSAKDTQVLDGHTSDRGKIHGRR